MLTGLIIAVLLLYIGLPLLALLLVTTMQAGETLLEDYGSVIRCFARLGIPTDYLIPTLLGVTPFILLMWGLLR